MPAPLPGAWGSGNASINVSVTASAATTTQNRFVDVALGRPALEALADICNVYGIRAADLINTADGSYKYKLRDPVADADLQMELSFLQNGISEGDSVELADAS
jgi:hypothetical protein